MANKFKKNISVIPKKEGIKRQEELIDNIGKGQGFAPKGVLIEDMDAAFIDYIENGIPITIGGERVPVIFLTIQRWNEFTQTWKFTDKYKDIKMPFITIVRKPDIQKGTSHIGLWNVAGKPHYTYIKVPTLYGGGRKGIDLYKIPQPTPIDINYEVRLFTDKMKSTNETAETIYKAFQSQQHYVWPNQHPMPITLENTGDESTIDDFENRRFYIIMYEMKLAGYILDPKDFIVKPAIDRAILVTEVEEDIAAPKFKLRNNTTTKTFNYGVIFQPNAESQFSFVSEFSLSINSLDNVENITNIIIKVNNIQVFSGVALVSSIIINANDTIYIGVTKALSSTGKFQLKGNLII